MNCLEFERILPEVLEGGHTTERQAHLNSCPACSNLLADLKDISVQAKTLADSAEPSPVVWNALEAQLRSEGLIRRPAAAPARLPWFRRSKTAWLVPVAIALAIAVGIKLYHPAGAGENEQAVRHIVVAPGRTVHPVSSDDQRFLNTMAARRPARQARYRADMDNANAFISDAEQVLKNNPGDVYAQQMLINAYEQKQMLYDLAVDRSSLQ
jgi:hypothetical protein